MRNWGGKSMFDDPTGADVGVETEDGLEVDLEDGLDDRDPGKSRLQLRLEEAAVVSREHERATAAGWERRLRERRAFRAEQRAGRPRRDLLRTSLLASGAILAATGLFIGGYAGVQSGSWSAERTELAQKISDAESELSEAQADRVDPEKVADSTSAQLTSVREDMGTVAKQQNDYADAAHKCYDDDPAVEGAPSKCADSLPAQRKPRASLWDEKSLVLEDEQIYQWTTQTGLAEGEIDPREEWNLITKDGIPLPASDQEWSGAGAKPRDDGSYEAMWIQTDGDGQLLAWATATWTPVEEGSDEGLFSTLSVQQMVRGGRIR